MVENGSSATVNGSVSAENTGLLAEKNSTATVTGNVSGDQAGMSVGDGSKVTVTGNVASANGDGISVNSQSTITVTGNVSGVGYGIRAGNSSTVTVTGNVSGVGYGIQAVNSCVVTVNGSVTATHAASTGVMAVLGAEVYVAEAVTASLGFFVGENSLITVDGTVSAANFARFNASEVPASAGTNGSGENAGYVVYQTAAVPGAILRVKGQLTPPAADPTTLTPQSNTYGGTGAFVFTSTGGYRSFTSFSANGTALVNGVDYTAESTLGGTRITVTEAAMQKLAGLVNFQIMFANGSARATVTVQQASINPPRRGICPASLGQPQCCWRSPCWRCW